MGEEIIPDRRDNGKVSDKVKGFFANPWVGIVTTILSITGFIFGIYAYIFPVGVHSLTFSISPVKAVAVKSGQVSDLMVSYKGIPITTDVVVVQIAVWNSGRLPIREENILKEIRIVTSPTSQILDASIREQSRDVISFNIDKLHFSEGYIPIKWKILERNDGAIIQIVYAGSVDTGIKVIGVVEGQTKLHYDDSKARSDNNSTIISIVGIITIMLVISIYLIVFKVKNEKASGLKTSYKPPLSIIGIFILLFIQLGLTIVSNKGGPPFGF